MNSSSGKKTTAAASQEGSGRSSGDVKFCAFAMVSQDPVELRYQDHMVPYQGQDDVSSIPWGVYGSAAMTSATYLANEAARRQSKRVLVLAAHVLLPNFSSATQKLPRTLKEADGFLHMARLGADLRDELHGEFLLYLKNFYSAQKVAKMADLEWAHLLSQEPAYLRSFMKEHLPTIRVMVHPVRQLLVPGQPRMEILQVGSFRAEKGVWAEVSYNSDITVTITP